MDEDDGEDFGSEGFEEQFLQGEQEQAEIIYEYKESRRKTTQGRRSLSSWPHYRRNTVGYVCEWTIIFF